MIIPEDIDKYEKLRTYLLNAAHIQFAPPEGGIKLSEHFLQFLWFERKLIKKLTTTDGKTVEIIQPGFWNHEAGPDFKNAVIKLEDHTLSGDIEIHLHDKGWVEHNHESDPAYNSVILHVAYFADTKERFVRNSRHEFIPQIIIQKQIAEPVEFLFEDYDPLESAQDSLPHYEAGRCAEVIQSDHKALLEILDNAGRQRFLNKAARWHRISENTSVRQALWEGICEALGYKNNKLPLRLLARKVFPYFSAKAFTPAERIAIMTGLSGFLPYDLDNKEESIEKSYILGLWNIWWKHRGQFAAEAGFLFKWRLDSTRPGNHPHRRIAAAALVWDLLPKLEKAIRSFPASLEDFETFPVQDEYWNNHYTLKGKPAKKSLQIIGADRWRQIQSNILAPMAYACAKTPSIQTMIFAQFARIPSPGSDHIIRAACQRLEITPQEVKGIVRKQGLHQIYQDFCLADRSDCANCPFPKFVSEWKLANIIHQT